MYHHYTITTMPPPPYHIFYFRQKEFRERNPTPIIKTWSQVQKMRAYWNERQQICRSKNHAQKKRRTKEYDKAYRQDKRNKYSEKKAKRDAAKEGRRSDEPKMKVKLAFGTPKKKHQRESKRAAVSQMVKDYKSINKASKATGLGWHYVSKVVKCAERNDFREKKKGKRISHEKAWAIAEFYLSDEASYRIGGVKGVNRKGEQIRFMKMTTKEAHQAFTKKTGIKLGITTFRKHRPKRVKVASTIPREECVCVKCTNIKLGSKALGFTMSVHQFVCSTVCQGAWADVNISCLQRQCNDCSAEKVLEMELPPLDQTITWTRWKRVEKKVVKKGQQKANGNKKGKGNSDKKVVKKVLDHVTEEGTVSELLDILIGELQSAPFHLFMAHWQQKQCSIITSSPPANTVIFMQDFAQNMLCRYQDEPQSKFWDHQQITIHPIIAFYNCAECKSVNKTEVTCVSDDLIHDSDAVVEFQEAVEENLIQNGITWEKKVFFSDGCGRQYKSKEPFYHMNKETTRHYFESGHGKSLCDSAIGVLKKQAKTAVNSGVIITSASQLAAWANQKLAYDDETACKHILRTYIVCNDINRPRSTNQHKAQTIHGCLEIHQITFASTDVRLVRRLSCNCERCLAGDYSLCTEQVLEPVPVNIMKKSSQKKVFNLKDLVLGPRQQQPPVSSTTTVPHSGEGAAHQQVKRVSSTPKVTPVRKPVTRSARKAAFCR